MRKIDGELVAKLERLLEMEDNLKMRLKRTAKLDERVAEFLQKVPFEIEDIPGREEVVLTRQFGDET